MRAYDLDYDGWENDHTYDPEDPPLWDQACVGLADDACPRTEDDLTQAITPVGEVVMGHDDCLTRHHEGWRSPTTEDLEESEFAY